MSLESALEQERREVLALLEAQPSAPSSRSHRPASPHVGGRAQSPETAQSPIRSMLDVGSPASPGRHASVAGMTGIPFATDHLKTSSSPSRKKDRSSSRSGVPHSPRASSRRLHSPSLNPEFAYQFEMMPTIEAHSMPKRVTQGGKKQARAMSSVYGSGDARSSSQERKQQAALSGLFGRSKSGSPGPDRSNSPGGQHLKSSLKSDSQKFVTDSGKVVDMSSAYRRLSDGALLRSSGTLSQLPLRKGSDPSKGESMAPGGGVRLATDDFGEDDEAAVESSDDDDTEGSSDADGEWGSRKRRGRRRTRQGEDVEDSAANKRVPKSLLAAAEDERKDVSASYHVRSLLEPSVTITGPDGEKMMTSKKHGVHPHTNFDNQSASGLSTPVGSDTEELSEMKAAQQLSMSLSPIHSSPEAHRCVRQIVRGKYNQFQEDAEKGFRRQRVYLVATDLSEEAAYALEWTIGTVLRDGDTLLAVYAVDEEIGVGGGEGVAVGGGATAQQETDSLMKTLSNTQRIAELGGTGGLGPGPSPLSNSVLASEVDVASMGKAEKERYQAAAQVSERCVKLLRKTRLQVRVVVEVFHCKSPKHMITEVIDFLEPTLVILGSRGRSALKGVLLGSFSNYLVTKSSVPVMVARKRLRKHSKYKRKNLRLSNVITNPSNKLANAKID